MNSLSAARGLQQPIVQEPAGTPSRALRHLTEAGDAWAADAQSPAARQARKAIVRELMTLEHAGQACELNLGHTDADELAALPLELWQAAAAHQGTIESVVVPGRSLRAHGAGDASPVAQGLTCFDLEWLKLDGPVPDLPGTIKALGHICDGTSLRAVDLQLDDREGTTVLTSLRQISRFTLRGMPTAPVHVPQGAQVHYADDVQDAKGQAQSAKPLQVVYFSTHGAEVARQTLARGAACAPTPTDLHVAQQSRDSGLQTIAAAAQDLLRGDPASALGGAALSSLARTPRGDPLVLDMRSGGYLNLTAELMIHAAVGRLDVLKMGFCIGMPYIPTARVEIHGDYSRVVDVPVGTQVVLADSARCEDGPSHPLRVHYVNDSNEIVARETLRPGEASSLHARADVSVHDPQIHWKDDLAADFRVQQRWGKCEEAWSDASPDERSRVQSLLLRKEIAGPDSTSGRHVLRMDLVASVLKPDDLTVDRCDALINAVSPARSPIAVRLAADHVDWVLPLLNPELVDELEIEVRPHQRIVDLSGFRGQLKEVHMVGEAQGRENFVLAPQAGIASLTGLKGAYIPVRGQQLTREERTNLMQGKAWRTDMVHGAWDRRLAAWDRHEATRPFVGLWQNLLRNWPGVRPQLLVGETHLVSSQTRAEVEELHELFMRRDLLETDDTQLFFRSALLEETPVLARTLASPHLEALNTFLKDCEVLLAPLFEDYTNEADHLACLEPLFSLFDECYLEDVEDGEVPRGQPVSSEQLTLQAPSSSGRNHPSMAGGTSPAGQPPHPLHDPEILKALQHLPQSLSDGKNEVIEPPVSLRSQVTDLHQELDRWQRGGDKSLRYSRIEIAHYIASECMNAGEPVDLRHFNASALNEVPLTVWQRFVGLRPDMDGLALPTAATQARQTLQSLLPQSMEVTMTGSGSQGSSSSSSSGEPPTNPRKRKEPPTA